MRRCSAPKGCFNGFRGWWYWTLYRNSFRSAKKIISGVSLLPVTLPHDSKKLFDWFSASWTLSSSRHWYQSMWDNKDVFHGRKHDSGLHDLTLLRTSVH